MQDDELVNLCKTIYQKHRGAIELIVEFGASSRLLDTCAETIAKLVDYEFLERKGLWIWFLPKGMSTIPEVDMSGWGFLPRLVPIVCWVQHLKQDQKLKLAMEVGPLVDQELRRRLLTVLCDAGFKFKDSAFKEGAKYTRILTRTEKLSSTEDGALDDSPEKIEKLIRPMWKKFWDEGSKITEVLERFNWKDKGSST